MKKYMTLIEGIVIGIAGLVMVLLGWADDSLKWILLILSPIIIVASVAIFFFQNSRDNQAASEFGGATVNIDWLMTTAASRLDPNNVEFGNAANDVSG